MMRDRTTPDDGSSGEPGEGLDNVLFDIWLVSRATTALIDEVVRPSGLDADEFAVYSVLAAGDRMTPTELARWMAAPPTTVSSYVKRFERRGHVERVANPDDRRSYHVRLTSAGRRAHLAAGELFLPIRERVTALVGPTVPDAHRLLRLLHDTVETVTDEGVADG